MDAGGTRLRDKMREGKKIMPLSSSISNLISLPMQNEFEQ